MGLLKEDAGREYLGSYSDFAGKAFTTITAHAPYYNLVSDSPEIASRIIKIIGSAVKRVSMAGAEVFNLHIDWRIYMDQRDLDAVADAVKKLLENTPEDMYIILETTYTRRQNGSLDEIKAVIEAVGSEHVIPSLQLENIFMYEKRLDQHGNFIQADKETNRDFRLNILKKAFEISHGFLSLRYSQVTGVYFGRRLLKKRVPLGKEYPNLEPLAEALAKFYGRRG